MNRAVLLIGVKKTGGNLRELLAVDDTIEKMIVWAQTQGIPDELIFTRTDKDGPVTVSAVYSAVEEIVQKKTIEQLIIYFSGHGLVNNRQEFWLLSNAPDNANEAVNLEGTIALARASALKHVVFISDACRTPADGLLAGRIRGSDIFPNVVDADVERAVDVFFATSLGAPALEVSVSTLHGDRYQAIFTETLVAALSGRIPQLVSEGYVRPRPLKKALPGLVGQALSANGLSILVSQVPDARITSDDEAWLSEVAADPDVAKDSPALSTSAAPGVRGGSRSRPGVLPLAVPPIELETETLMSSQSLANLLVDAALDDGQATVLRSRLLSRLQEKRLFFSAPAEDLMATYEQALSTDDAQQDSDSLPRNASAAASIHVHGAVLCKAVLQALDAKYLEISPNAIAFTKFMDEDTQVLLEFQGGDGVLIPLISEYQAIIEFDNGQLSDISYRSLRTAGTQVRNDPWSLEAAVKAVARIGAFAIEERQAEKLTEQMRHVRTRDPILAVLACYALNELGDTRRIIRLRDALLDQAAATFFDLSLLSRDLLRQIKNKNAAFGAPVCAQGWAFVNALGGSQKDRLNTLREHLVPSRWTHFTPGGVNCVKTEMIASGATVLQVNVGRDT